MERTVAGSDAVVSALGHAKGAPDDILARATTNVIALYLDLRARKERLTLEALRADLQASAA